MLKLRYLCSAAAIALGVAFAAPQVNAGTPADTLVIAWAIDDVITLDPAQSFEITTTEVIGNGYRKLVQFDEDDVSQISGDIAEEWKVSADGKTISFTIKQGLQFASGNPITADDAVFSIQRAVKLDKTPAFILQQFGLNKDNVDQMVKKTGDMTFDFTMDKAYATSFALYCLTATVGSVVDSKEVMAHEKDGDMGNGWLSTNFAGSGPFVIREWRPNEAIVLERNDNFSGGDKAKLARVIYRHVPEPQAERLLLEKGDVDVARKLGAEDIDAVSKQDGISIATGPQGEIYYLGLNQKNQYLGKPEVREAMKYLVDYQTIADTIMKGKVTVHQTYLPDGFLGAISDNPYKLDVAKAKELLAKAGLKDGFPVTMDTRNTQDITAMATAIQQTLGEAGIKLEIIPGDGKQTLTKYRARNHDIYIGTWGPDYQDPNTNAQTFASNPDNSDDTKLKTLAWRNAWDIPELTKETDAAVLELDTAKRKAMYEDSQKKVLADSAFVVMFQKIEVDAVRSNVKNYKVRTNYDDLARITKE